MDEDEIDTPLPRLQQFHLYQRMVCLLPHPHLVIAMWALPGWARQIGSVTVSGV